MDAIGVKISIEIQKHWAAKEDGEFWFRIKHPKIEVNNEKYIMPNDIYRKSNAFVEFNV